MASSSAPLTQMVTAPVAAVAITADLTTPVAVAPFDGTVAAEYIPTSVLTGGNTNSRTINVYNRGQAGAGTTVVASKAFVTGTDAPANDATPITASAVAGATEVVAGDVIDWESLHILTGIADPGGLAKITFSRVQSE